MAGGPVARFLETASRAQLETFSKRLLIENPRRLGTEALREAIASRLKVRLGAFPANGPTARAVERRPELEVHADTFAAIDFETADDGRDSACAVAVVRVEGGRVVEKQAALLRPPRRSFAFTHVHGITWETVKGAPPFAEAWPRFRPLLEGASRLWAHNATFDRSVMRACCAAGGLEPPSQDWACSMRLARRAWGFRRPNLANVARALGIPLRHHEAVSDAEACARIVLRALSAGLVVL